MPKIVMSYFEKNSGGRVTSGHKIAVSLLTAVIVFAAFAVAAFAGLFSVVEARFYQPVVLNSIEQRLDNIEKQHTEYIDSLINRFTEYSSDSAVGTYMLSKPKDDDVRSRTNTTGELFIQTPALRGIRLIDSNGRYVHFSTFNKDILKKNDSMVSYNNYTELGELPYDTIKAEDVHAGAEEKNKVIRDGAGNRIIFTFPYYDNYKTYRGTIAFYCDPLDFTRFLLSRNIITVSDTGKLVSDSQTGAGGIVFGLPSVGSSVIENIILEKWNQDEQLENVKNNNSKKEIKVEKIASDENNNWILFSKNASENGHVAIVSKDDILIFPSAVRVLLLTVVFITLFLIVFLLFNLKHDDMVVIKDRIRRFQLAFVTEYLNKKDSDDLKKLPDDIASRRQVVNDAVRKSLGRRGRKHSSEVDELLSKSWDEILTTLGAKPGTSLPAAPVISEANTAELRKMLEEILGSGTVKIQTIAAPQSVKPIRPQKGIPEAEPVEDISAAEPVEAESVEEIPEAEPVEEIPEAEPVEEIPEAEPVEEIPAAEPVEAESVEEIPEAEPVEEIPEAESVEEIPAAEPVEAEPVEEIPEAEPVEEIPAAEPVEAESVEEIPEAEPVEEIPEAEPVEEIPAAEPVEEIPEAEAVEEIPAAAEPVEAVEAEPVDLSEFTGSSSSTNDKTSRADGVTYDFSEPMKFGEPPKEKDASEDDEQAVEGFSIERPSFSFLDDAADTFFEKAADADSVSGDEIASVGERNREEVPLAEAAPEDNKQETQEVSLSEFGMDDNPKTQEKSPSELADFAEPIGFSSPSPAVANQTNVENKDNENDFDSFVISHDDKPDYSNLDANDSYEFIPQTDSMPKAGVNLAPLVDSDDLAELVEPLATPEDSHPFLFTKFAANNDNITELTPAPSDAIVESNDGTYSVSNTIETDSIKQDSAFKKLVESVLK